MTGSKLPASNCKKVSCTYVLIYVGCDMTNWVWHIQKASPIQASQSGASFTRICIGIWCTLEAVHYTNCTEGMTMRITLCVYSCMHSDVKHTACSPLPKVPIGPVLNAPEVQLHQHIADFTARMPSRSPLLSQLPRQYDELLGVCDQASCIQSDVERLALTYCKGTQTCQNLSQQR